VNKLTVASIQASKKLTWHRVPRETGNQVIVVLWLDRVARRERDQRRRDPTIMPACGQGMQLVGTISTHRSQEMGLCIDPQGCGL